MMSVAFEYPSNAVESVTQDAFRVFFKGSELVVAGKLWDHSPDLLSAQVRGQLVSVTGHSGGEEQLGQAVRGAGLKPQPCRLQPIDLEQVTECPLPPVGDAAPLCWFPVEIN